MAGKGGMAILEGSRALEDYSMAGMRGALNNIPGVMQNLGASNALTGFTQIALVAMWKLVEATEVWLDKQTAATEEFANQGLGALNLGERIKSATKAAKDMSDAMNEVYEKTSMVYAELAAIDDTKVRVESSSKTVENARELLRLEKEGASAAVMKITALRQQRDELHEQYKLQEESVKGERRKVENLKGGRVQFETAIDRADEAKNTLGELQSESKRESAKIAYRHRNGVGSRLTEIEIRKANAEFEKQWAFKIRSAEADIKAGVEAEQMLAIQNKQIEKAEHQLFLAEQAAAAAQSEMRDKAKLLALEAERERLAASQAKLELEKKAKASMLMTSSSMLSGAGQKGFAAKEATNSVNLLRASNAYLKKIAQNTKGAKAPIAG
jgi:hypothetical protein